MRFIGRLRYFEEMAVALVSGDDGKPDQQLVAEIMERYELVMDYDSIPVLAQRYGLIP